jgi:hypothetical protein
LFYVVDNSLDEEAFNDEHKANLLSLAQFSRSMFGEETMGKLMLRVLKMKGQAEYLGIDLKSISRVNVSTSKTRNDATAIY